MRRIVLMLCGALVLAGCQEQRTFVLENASAGSLASTGPLVPAPVPHRVVFSPCSAPAGTGPFEHIPQPIASSSVPMPPRALSEHVNGCAGVRFRIGPDGAPEDVAVLAEYPLNYGFGNAAYAAVAATRWPARDDEAWRYVVFNMHPSTPASP